MKKLLLGEAELPLPPRLGGYCGSTLSEAARFGKWFVNLENIILPEIMVLPYNGETNYPEQTKDALMEIEGTYTLQALPTEVWDSLMDQQTVQRAVAGLERLTKEDEQSSYAFVIHLRHAPLRGTYAGRASVLEQHYPTSYLLKIEGEGQPSRFHGEWHVQLSPRNDNTVVIYKGSIHLGKSGALIPAPLVKGTVKVLVGHFFTTLADQLRTTSHELPAIQEGRHEASSAASEPHEAFIEASPGFLYRLVQVAKLGRHDPALEERWVRRLRRIGIASILLLLIWIGTRLPRRFVSHSS